MPGWEKGKRTRPEKGAWRMGLPLDYVVIDTETTGIDRYSCVIEAAALRVRGGEVAGEFSTLIRPPRREIFRDGAWEEGFVEPFITQLTGITDAMLEGAPQPGEALPRLLEFLGEDPLLGHNVHFDVNFLYDALEDHLGLPLSNDYLDTLRISRKLLPQLPHHRLGDLAEALGVPYQGAHRALGDCRITHRCYLRLRGLALERYTEEEFRRLFEKGKKRPSPPLPAGDPDHPFYGKRVFFAGELRTLSRREAKDLVARAGGIPGDGTRGRADYLVVGGASLPALERGGVRVIGEEAFLALARLPGTAPEGAAAPGTQRR